MEFLINFISIAAALGLCFGLVVGSVALFGFYGALAAGIILFSAITALELSL